MAPYLSDPDHNSLLSALVPNAFAFSPAGHKRLAAVTSHEAFHAGGHRNLPWSEDFAAKGTPFRLTPGDGLYVPVKAPHWVKNGAEVSISFSITWRSEWSFHEEYAHGCNRLLRSLGLNPAAPRRYPDDNRWKSTAYRALRRAERAVRGERT